MEFRDLKLQYQLLKSEIDEAIIKATAGGHFIMGPEVKELEVQLAEYVGVKHCLTCANGTDALTLALKAWGIGPGDAVFVPDFTFFASAETIAAEGATPIFVDVDSDTFNMDPEDLERAIGEVLQNGQNPKAIVTVDLFGQPAEYPRIRQIADRYGLKILEDGAQGFGGSINGRKACSFGDIATTSFFPAKPLGCYGDGGAVFTDNDDWAVLMDSLRVHGKGSNKYENIRLGLNSRLDTIQAAILLVKLKAFKEKEIESVNAVAKLYDERLKGIVKTPVIKHGFTSSWAQYTIQLEGPQQRAKIQSALKENCIPSMVYYPLPMHEQKAFSEMNPRKCPTASELCGKVLALPLHPYMTEEQVDEVCKVIATSL